MILVRVFADSLLSNITDVGDSADLSPGYRHMPRIKEGLRSLAKVGMLYQHEGTPTAKPALAGAFTIDTTNQKLYVCTDRSTPTWTEVTE